MDQFIVSVILIMLGLAVFGLLLMNSVSRMYKKIGPNEALLVFGRRQARVISNGGVFVLPFIEQCDYLSLELMSFDVAPLKDLYTNQGVAVNVEAVTQLKVRSDRQSILTAAEQFLSKADEDREGLIRLVMEGHLRGIVGQLTVEQLVKEPEMVSEKMRVISSSDLAKMGLEVVSFTIKEVRDNNDYIANMGRPEIERIKKEANIAAALATRDTQIQQAAAMRESSIAKSQADQARVEAEAVSQTKQAEFQRDLSLKRATYDAEVKKEQASADKSYDIQTNVMQQQVVAEATRVQEIEKIAQVKVQEAEIKRRELELEATVLKGAEAERRRVEMTAAAERQRLTLEAEGQAEAIRLCGLAQAEVIRACGEAEATAMQLKADAYQDYNQAAVLDKVIAGLPEVVRALAEPLSKVDKVTIVSTGAGDGQTSLGASRITGDIVNMLAQVPAIIETFSGVKLDDLMGLIPGLTGLNTHSTSPVTAKGTEYPPAAPVVIDSTARANGKHPVPPTRAGLGPKKMRRGAVN